MGRHPPLVSVVSQMGGAAGGGNGTEQEKGTAPLGERR